MTITHSYEMFVESIGRIALIVFENPSLKGENMSISEKINVFITIWDLGDQSLLALHKEERAIAEFTAEQFVCFVCLLNMPLISLSTFMEYSNYNIVPSCLFFISNPTTHSITSNIIFNKQFNSEESVPDNAPSSRSACLRTDYLPMQTMVSYSYSLHPARNSHACIHWWRLPSTPANTP